MKWEVVKITEVASIVSGNTPKDIDREFSADGEIPYYRISDMNIIGNEYEMIISNNKISKEICKKNNIKICPPSTIIFPKRGGAIFTNKKRILSTSASFDLNTMGLVPNDRVDKKYFYHWFSSVNISTLADGSSVPQLNNKQIAPLEIPLPPLPIQQKIAAILDAADAYRQKTKALIEKYDLLAQSLFLEMFGDPVRNEMGWETKTVSEICINIYGGGTPSKAKPEYYMGNIPWVTPKDMKSIKITDSIDHVTKEAIQNSSTRLIKSGAILMVIRSGILKHTLPVAINSVDVTVNQDMKAFIPNTNYVSSLYLLHFFIAGQHVLLSKVRAVTADNIEFQQIKELTISIPPLNLQEKFSDRIALIDQQKQQAQQSYDKAEALFNSLLQRAFKGELVS